MVGHKDRVMQGWSTPQVLEIVACGHETCLRENMVRRKIFFQTEIKGYGGIRGPKK